MSTRGGKEETEHHVVCPTPMIHPNSSCVKVSSTPSCQRRSELATTRQLVSYRICPYRQTCHSKVLGKPQRTR